MLQQSHLQRNRSQTRKQRLYRFFHSLLAHYSLHPNLYYLFLFIQTLQLANYAMHFSYVQLWNNNFTIFLQKILAYTDLSSIWRIMSPASLLIFAGLGLLINAIAMGLLIYQVQKDASKVQQPNILVIKFVTLFAVLLKSILLLPLIVAFSAFISPSLYGLSTQQQILLAIVSVVGIIITLTNCCIYVLFLRDNSPFSKLPFASSVNIEQEIRCAIKIGLGIYGSFIQPSASLPKVFCVIYTLSLAGMVYQIYDKGGMIRYPFNRITQLTVVIAFWISLSALMQLIITPTETIGIVYCLVGILLIPFGWSYLVKCKRQKLLASNYKAIHSSSECLIYNYECIRLVDSRNQQNNLIVLQGILNMHIFHCKKAAELCGCKKMRDELIKFSLDQQKKEIQKQRKLWFQFIRTNLTEVRQKYQKVTEIRFLLAYIQNDVLSNKFRSLHSLQQSRESGGGYKFQFLDYHYLREVERKMQMQDRVNNQKKQVDINRYYNFQMGFGKLREQMEESTYQHVTFWEVLKSNKASKSKLYDEGVGINRKLDQIKYTYQKLTHINPNNIHCLVLFSNFMKVIVNSNEAYERNQQTIQTVKRSLAQNLRMQGQVQKQKYGDNSVSAIVIISGERSNIGIIKHCNWKVSEIIGYAPHQLLGQNINLLMPKFIGNMHDDVLRNYLELSQSQFDFVERLVPMIDAHNFMVLARVLTKPLPSLLNGLELVGIFNAVAQSSLNHPGERPKYVLYRSDTGQVQALSETCHSQFHYKINKIDENNQTSSQLTFSTLFFGAKQADIIQNQGFRCRIAAKTSNSSQLDEVPVQVFQRLQIYYYSVRLRLLYFYTLKSYRQMEQTINSAANQLEPGDQLLAQQHEWQKQQKTDRSIIQQKAIKQKFLHQMSKKSSLIGHQPIAYKILRTCGWAYFLSMLIISIVYIVLHTRTTKINDYLQLSILTGETTGDICQINYNARLMHLAYYYPTYLTEYSLYQNNISISVTSLQNGQFQIQSIFLNYASYDESLSKEWIINQNGEITTSSVRVDVNVFDYVTASSSFNKAVMSQLNYPLNLKNTKSITQHFMDLFKVRFTGLFETIPKKLYYREKCIDIFNKLFNDQFNNSYIEMGVALGFLVFILCVIIVLSLSVISSIDQTIMLFGHMSKNQIQKQIQNCNSFLQIFYQDSYLIRLRKKQKSKDFNSTNPFAVDQIKLITNQQGGGTSKQFKSMVGSQSDLKQMNSARNMMKASVDKIQFLQKQLHLRTEAQILVSQTEQQNQNQMLRNQGEGSEQQGSIFDVLSQQKDNSRIKMVFIYLFIISSLASYFLTESFLYRKYLNDIITEISHLQQGFSNINSFKLVKLYSLQTMIDNSAFSTYSTVNTTAKQSYFDLYQNQRNFDTIALPQNQTLFPYYYMNLCDQATIQKLSIVEGLKVFNSKSFTAGECSSLLNGVLQEGLRLAIVGYTETILNYTKWTNLDSIIKSTTFLQTQRMQKYIEAPTRAFVNNHKTQISNLIAFRTTILAVLLTIFIIVILFLFICVWRKNLIQFHERLRATRLILGFIPVRVFIKNAKLTKQYQKYIGDLME